MSRPSFACYMTPKHDFFAFKNDAHRVPPLPDPRGLAGALMAVCRVPPPAARPLRPPCRPVACVHSSPAPPVGPFLCLGLVPFSLLALLSPRPLAHPRASSLPPACICGGPACLPSRFSATVPGACFAAARAAVGRPAPAPLIIACRRALHSTAPVGPLFWESPAAFIPCACARPLMTA